MGISKRATGCALGFGSLKHLIVFGLGGPFFHKLFAIGSSFIIFIPAWHGEYLVPFCARHRIPALGFECEFQKRLFRIDIQIFGQFAFGLFPFGHRRALRGATIDDCKFARAFPHHRPCHSA